MEEEEQHQQQDLQWSVPPGGEGCDHKNTTTDNKNDNTTDNNDNNENDKFISLISSFNLLPSKQYEKILIEEFFERWLRIIIEQIDKKDDTKKIINYYKKWRGKFPQEVIEKPVIFQHFNYALDYMMMLTWSEIMIRLYGKNYVC